MKIHFDTTRVLGIWNFPLCFTFSKLLDCDKGRLPKSRNIAEVTCKHCLRRFAQGYTK